MMKYVFVLTLLLVVGAGGVMGYAGGRAVHAQHDPDAQDRRRRARVRDARGAPSPGAASSRCAAEAREVAAAVRIRFPPRPNRSPSQAALPDLLRALPRPWWQGGRSGGHQVHPTPGPDQRRVAEGPDDGYIQHVIGSGGR